MRIIAYVDGFSVYYACFRGPTKIAFAGLKWLNYRALIEALFPDDRVVLVRIFTAIAPNPPDDPSQANRHDTYLRALRAIPDVEVHTGRFQKAKREALLVRPPAGVPALQTVYILQEKKSDVSLASHLLMDAVEDRFDRAVLLTNDTDFVVPVRIARERLGREVVLVSPDVTISDELRKAASAGWILDRGQLFKCQLPNPVIGPDGREIRKPDRW
jgi:uncharacterized LabA/DUF88 family protein